MAAEDRQRRRLRQSCAALDYWKIAIGDRQWNTGVQQDCMIRVDDDTRGERAGEYSQTLQSS
ncbi:MAG: hypothetical protein KME45_20510 [Stenomitos rutilans HA7619-LM2]|nr:hypothetical protein [Stenomitos rutilans HA7619-LM2]